MPLDYPPQGYYVSAKLRLVLRLDEFGQTKALAPPPGKTTKNLNGIKDPRAQLQAVPDPGAPPGVRRFVLLAPGQTKAATALEQPTSPDGLTFDLTVIPRQMDLSIAGLRTANTLSAQIRYLDCPIDPRVVRACAVEAFVGTVTEEDYKRGIQGARRDPTGAPLNLIPDTYERFAIARTNSRFQGWVDKWTAEWNDDDEPSIQLECRDNTSLLLEAEVPPKLVLDMNKGIDEAVAQYLAHFNTLQGMSVEYRPGSATPPRLKDALSNTAYRPKLGPPPSKGAGATAGAGGGGKQSVFDYLTDVCRSIGHAVFVEGTTVVIQLPRTLTTQTAVRRDDDPFQGRTLGDGTHLDYRRFIYGRNVKSMRVSRAYAKTAPTNVEVRCYAPHKKKVLIARFPVTVAGAPDGHRGQVTHAQPGAAQPEQKWLVLNVTGIKDEKYLRLLAQSTYEQIGRNEMEVEIKTRNLASFGGGNLDPDILDMRFGDTFEVLVNRSDDEVSTLTQVEKALSAQARGAALLKAMGLSDAFADAYAKAYNDAGFLTQFRLKSLKIGWNIDEGVDIEIVGVNFLEVRNDKLLPEGEEPAGDGSSGKKTSVNNKQ